jgi:exodeoxyribonuclease III
VFRVITVNVNGLRSAASKGFLAWAEKSGADCMGLQEVRMQASDIASHGFACIGPLQGHFACAAKKGYAGTALYTRHEPSDVRIGFGVPEFDDEGRWTELRFDSPARKRSIISSYFPSGSAGPERQASKDRFLVALAPYLAKLKRGGREVILIGDVNIAHRDIDLKNWKSNQKNSGCLPHERAWMTAQMAARTPLVDVYRHLHPTEEAKAYTWWSQRGAARANNVGWRIDVQLASQNLAAQARRAEVFTAQAFSDHAPLVVDYDTAA